MIRTALLALLLAPPASAADSLLPPPQADRGTQASALLRLDPPATGPATLDLEWTDTLGRVAERRSMALTLSAAAEIAIPLDLRRAVALHNTLAVTLTQPGAAPRHATARFIARPPPGWPDWTAIMWHDQTEAGHAALHALGITGGKVFASREPTYDAAALEARLAPPLAADARWYVENIATDFYANYHRWRPDRASVTWLFDETKRRHRENPADPSVNHREPSLCDPAALAPILARLRATAAHQAPYRPLFLNLADEPGIADLAAAWDFDTSPACLAGFRTWLRTQYRDLAALNRQWGSSFPSWAAILPPTTDEALARADRNWSGWADFKAFMDHAFAATLRAGRDAVHEADPTALAGIGGAQLPGWGGYDYTHLAGALDVIEAYQAGNNIALARSLNPRLVLLTTSFATGPAEAARLWREALLGVRGAIIWDEDRSFLTPANTPGPRAAALSPTLRELASGLGTLLIASRPHHDRVAILYSQASFRTQWMEAVRASPTPWTERSSETEWNFTPPHRAAREAAARALSATGAQPRWLTSARIESGALRGPGAPRLLVLPQVTALSDAEAAEIRSFVARGGRIWAIGTPGTPLGTPLGTHDGRSRPRAAPVLAGLAPARAITLSDTLPAIPSPAIPVTGAPEVETRIHRNGAVWIIGLQRRADTPADATASATLTPPRGHAATDLRTGTALKLAPDGTLRLTLAGHAPRLVALAPAATRLTLAAPAQARPGDLVPLRPSLASPATAPILRVITTLPDGTTRQALQRGPWHLPLAARDPPGTWRVRVTDVLSGVSAERVIEVK
jgi:hypothetical protein